jgi:biotin transport system ATP-binding protein
LPTIELDAAAVRVPLPGRGEREILAPTTLTLAERRIGIIGANGSGKSTLARMLNGLVRPTSGRVVVEGHDVVRDGAAVRRMVGFCFTDPAAQLVMPTCIEDVELSLRRRFKDGATRRERALEVLAVNGLAEHAHDSVHSLSGGQRQLLALAGVLALEPTVVVADEPTTLLDRANTRRIGDTLFGLDQQLVLVTHDLDLAARCDRVVVVDSARVVADGPPPEAIAHYTALVDGVSTA